MTAIVEEITRMQITTILNRYRFEMRGYNTQELLDRWLPTYSLDWIRMAVLEALYRGRYKAISVEEILKTWQKRGYPTYNFTREFERLVCKNLPGGAIESNEPIGTVETPAPLVRGKRETDKVAPHPSETAPLPLTPLERPVFDDPRKKMSDIGELFSKLTVESEIVTGESESDGNESEGNGKETNGADGPSGPSIDQFIPLLDGSELYSKLKAVARSGYGDR
ncbi:hypothetical protein V0288_01875 [Pannus brasiliensis CCIBt3594]|uniref:DnaD domain protein n=1 Tax=Pannus brasiliensis CCIBt3594 TaxID=1427578 RepID=A0AAW9QFF9_9CHRO